MRGLGWQVQVQKIVYFLGVYGGDCHCMRCEPVFVYCYVHYLSYNITDHPIDTDNQLNYLYWRRDIYTM